MADRWGDVVSYTLTLEQFGGSAITVPHRGFLLNNEMTDFDFTSATPAGHLDPNLPAAGKRPRSSMAPTIVLRNGRPFLAVGSPGGSTIITTVLQILMNRLDLGMTLPEALAAPRATQRNTPQTLAEQGFIDRYGPLLTPYGHTLQKSGDQLTSAAEIGAATAVEFGPDGLLTAVSEPTRRGEDRRWWCLARQPADQGGGADPVQDEDCAVAGRAEELGVGDGHEEALVAAVGAEPDRPAEHQPVCVVSPCLLRSQEGWDRILCATPGQNVLTPAPHDR